MPTQSPAWSTAKMSPEEAAERKANRGYTLAEADEVAMDPAMWARMHGRVEHNVSKQAVPFEPSALQLRMFSRYKYCQERNIPCRMVVPKTRRGGGSTGACALLYLHAHNYAGARVASIGTFEKVSMNLFSMMRFFDKHDDYPLWKRANKVLETGEMRWPNGSIWEKYTADNPESARSAGLSAYGASEVGRWANGGACDARETLQSMQGAVPRHGFTCIIEESTCQGANGVFYDRFTNARWPTADELGVAEGKEYWRIWADETPQNVASGEAERDVQFVRVFSAWFESDENRPGRPLSAESVSAIKSSRDEAENKLIARYRTIGPQGERLGHTAIKATLWEQLAWRRATIATEFDGDVDAFAQENPSSPSEGFSASGRHTFNREGCAWMTLQAKGRHPQIGVLTRQGDGVVFSPKEIGEAGWVHVWQEPREGYRYIGGLDTCGGRSNQKNSDRADYNEGMICRASTTDPATGIKSPHAIVACLAPRNQFDPDVLAERMKLLSDYYGGCMVVIEKNNTGLAVIQEAIRLQMNLYREESIDPTTSIATPTIGWTTTAKSRELLIGSLKKHIRNNANAATRGEGVDCPVLHVAEQCQDMIVGANGKDQAPGGKHDDAVVSLGLCLQCITGATYLSARKRRRHDPPDMKGWRSMR